MTQNNNSRKTAALLVVVIIAGYGITSAAAASDRILLNDVQTITLKRGEMTTGRRSSPLPQIECVSGSAVPCQGKYLPESVQCKNVGTDGVDVQWECNADLPSDTKFGLAEVNCEGYYYPRDPYVLVGSCQLRYNLKFRDRAAASLPVNRRPPAHSNSGVGAGGLILAALGLLALSSCGTNNGTGGPGFWTGLGLGALAAGARRSRRRGRASSR